MVAHGRPIRNHAHGISADLLEAPATSGALGCSTILACVMGRRPDRPPRQLLPISRLGSLWIWLVARPDRPVEPPELRSPGDGTGRLALCALPQPDRPWRARDHGVAAGCRHDGHVRSFLAVSRYNAAELVWSSAAAGGVAFSCKFTAILFPPILAAVWWVASAPTGTGSRSTSLGGWSWYMLGFMAVMLVTNLAVTGFACVPLSTTQGRHPTLEKWLSTAATAALSRFYEMPIPQDWVGFATQLHHQASGGASYLWGERRMSGWWYYYFVALAVKVPLGLWLLVSRGWHWRSSAKTQQFTRSHIELLPLVVLFFLGITAVGSSRNYGMRYLLPSGPLGHRLGVGPGRVQARDLAGPGRNARPCRLRSGRRANATPMS